MFFLKKDKKNTIKGFSMTELLVTIAILTVVTTMVFFNHSQFNNNVLLENLAYEISLTIRQAQSYGVQVKEVAGSFDQGYGVYFNVNSSEFIIFADTYPAGGSDFVYSAGHDEIIDTLVITNGNDIEDLCVKNGATEDCSVDTVSISFLRPNPAAIITANSVSSTEYDSAEIKIISPKGIEKEIFVNRVGQISVKTAD